MTTPVGLAPKESSMRPALWLAFGLGLATLALSTNQLLTHPGSGWLDYDITGILVSELSAPILAVAAAILVGRALKQSPTIQPIQYYVLRALRLFRYLLVVDIALMPAIVLGRMDALVLQAIFGVSLSLQKALYCIGCSNHGPAIPALPGPIVGQTLSFLLLVLGWWGLCLLVPTLAAVVTHVSQSTRLGVAIAWTAWGALGYVLGASPEPTRIILAALPYLLTALIIILARPISKALVDADSRQSF
jgi:hypothetical protein